ncbi:uncharacterized protein LOC119587602 [Penaeus monodon]|uniref:uncharacterized protein LOC119587602 n=1 Tax=Penaeus monodon TaxID=6687 RepID=UPI0018A7148C|nr:uncharacterized protein LOC119587602 [Penaeus monodon]
MTTRDYQGLPFQLTTRFRTIGNYRGLPGTTKDYQGLPGTTKNYQGLPFQLTTGSMTGHSQEAVAHHSIWTVGKLARAAHAVSGIRSSPITATLDPRKKPRATKRSHKLKIRYFGIQFSGNVDGSRRRISSHDRPFDWI